MELLAALARYGHFARAAESCGISQPAFSARIKNLETTLGVPIVRRGNRFQGLTAEGEVALRWARRMLADAEGMAQEISAAAGVLSGRLVIGVVPTALAVAAMVPARLRETFPALTVEIVSMTSADVLSGLADHRLDAGITYLWGDMPRHLRSRMLYRERYCLIAHRDMAPPGDSITWTQAAKLPLCLLMRSMQNRAILDETFASVGQRPEPVVETNALTASLVQAATGVAATIVPEHLLDVLPLPGDVRRLALVDPVLERPIGLLMEERVPRLPALEALEQTLASMFR